MFLLPSINSKNIFEDGSFINALSFCKNNFCTDRRCIEHYKKLVENIPVEDISAVFVMHSHVR